MTPNMLRGKRIMRGKVTSVGDSDNFRFYHTPGGIWAGWGWLRHVPTTKKGKQDFQENSLRSSKLAVFVGGNAD